MVKQLTIIPVLNTSNEEIKPQYVDILNADENIQLKNMLLNLKLI